MFYFVIIFFFPNQSFAQESIQGVVVNVTDGDIVTVWEKEKQYKVRLYGIDTPENKLGIWIDTDFVPPWNFRKGLTTGKG